MADVTEAKITCFFLKFMLNGTADPLPVLESFSLMEDKLPFFPRLQICLVDARQWGERGDLTALEKRQLETAGYWLLSHSDAVDEARIAAVSESVRSFAPHTLRITAAEFAELLTSETDTIPTPTSPAGESCHAESDHDHHCDPVHRISHRFTGCTLPLPHKVRRHSIVQLLAELPDWASSGAKVRVLQNPSTKSVCLTKKLPISGGSVARASSLCILWRSLSEVAGTREKAGSLFYGLRRF